MQIQGGAAMMLLIWWEHKCGAIILAGKYAEEHFSLTSMIVLFLIDKPIVGKKLQMLEMVSTTMRVTLNHCHLAS